MPQDRSREGDRERDHSRSRRAYHRTHYTHSPDLTHEPPLPPPLNRRRSTAPSPSASIPRPHYFERASYMSSDTMMSDESWPEEDAPESSTRKNEQPMSPLVVILYVVFFYLVWQILTRSDETEILSHLPSTSPLRGQQQSHAIAEQSSQQQHYQFPYPLAPFPSPARDVEKSSTSTWRTVWHSVLYPFYLLVTLAVIPLPFLNQALTLLMSVLGTIMYPLTSTARLLSRTFIVGPLQLVTGLFQALYPAYVFVGGVLGLGCFLGMSAGYIGRYSLDFLLTRRSSKNRKTRSKTRKHSTHKTRVQEFTAAGRTTTTTTRATVFEHPLSGHRAPLSPEVRTFHGRYVPVADIWDNPDLSAVNSSASARQPVVVGLRRRGMRIDDS